MCRTRAGPSFERDHCGCVDDGLATTSIDHSCSWRRRWFGPLVASMETVRRPPTSTRRAPPQAERKALASRAQKAASAMRSDEAGGDRAVNLVWAGLIVVGVAAVAIAAMLFVRRTAPEGSYFE